MLSKYCFATVLAVCSLNAWAHYPYIDCQKTAQGVECEVGFSDGSDAIGSEVVMYTYDDDVIARAKADQFSKVHFDWSDEEFYIQFDAGHEDPAEYDYAEF
ncbi:hypothetical protein DN062_12615 [Nitrincola tibetensis]|uniref:Uncharacterized protein n=1 Tax=Nitrincola tibetensis TaxID=2219697 RepID=A0A364NK67_9GAMM|nr:hypothetical protein [Nitrincola tibetensis]RAU17528.1 hypothetical protein DN062_12615 [Nitrincola tibetensis]